MKSKVYDWLAVMTFVLMSGFSVVGCNSGTESSYKASQPTKDTVKISGMTFHPDTITVNKGDTIVFINDDIVTHDVSHYDDKSWTSGPLDPGDSWEHQFNDSTTYFCSIHPTMIGKVEIK